MVEALPSHYLLVDHLFLLHKLLNQQHIVLGYKERHLILGVSYVVVILIIIDEITMKRKWHHGLDRFVLSIGIATSNLSLGGYLNEEPLERIFFEHIAFPSH